MKKINPHAEVTAAHKMGRLEARVADKDDTLKASDFTLYLNKAERSKMMADNKVLVYIIDNKVELFKSARLKKAYEAYKSKYWKKSE